MCLCVSSSILSSTNIQIHYGKLTLLFDVVVVFNQLVTGGSPLLLLLAQAFLVGLVPLEQAHTHPGVQVQQVVTQREQVGLGFLVLQVQELCDGQLQVRHHLCCLRLSKLKGFLVG